MQNGASARLSKSRLLRVVAIDRTIKEETVKCFHYDRHEHLRTHLNDIIAAYNFGRRLERLSGLIPYEHVCKYGLESQKNSLSIQLIKSRD